MLPDGFFLQFFRLGTRLSGIMQSSVSPTIFIWIFVSTAAYQAFAVGIYLTPTSNQVIPVTSLDNVTYECMISGNRILRWEVNHVQIEGDRRREFEDTGVFLEEQGTNRSTLIITRQAREAYSNQSNIPVRCSAFTRDPPRSDFSNSSFVFTYGVPDPPQSLALQASAIPSRPPVLSWQRPPNIPKEVSITYHLRITNLTSNAELLSTTDMLSYPLPQRGGCSLFEFNIIASNDVGNSTTESIMETVPITPDVRPINNSLRVESVDVRGGRPSVTLFFEEAQTCSDRYRVTDYRITSSDGIINVIVDAVSNFNNYTVLLDQESAPNLVRGLAYDVSVIACNNFTCKESQAIPVFTTDVQNPRVRYVNTDVNLTCNFAEGSTAEGCVFNFTGVSTEQNFFVNRTGDSLVASSCAVAEAVADNMDFTWSAFDDGGDIPIAVTLIPVDSQDQDNFECIPMAPGQGGQAPGDQGFTPGQIGGIVGGIVGGIGLTVLIGLVILVVFLVFQRNQKNKQKKSRKEEITKKFEGPQATTDGGGIELTREEEQEPLLSYEMEVVSKKEGTVRFIIQYKEKAIKRRILAAP